MPTSSESISKINKMIDKIEVAMLVTVDTKGRLHSRPMMTPRQEFDGDIWFFVTSDSEIVREIKTMSQVNVTYSENGRFVSISGEATIVTDVARKRELWHPELKAWFDGKQPEDREVVLIRISGTEASYWKTGDGTIGNALRTMQVLLTGDVTMPIETGHTRL